MVRLSVGSAWCEHAHSSLVARRGRARSIGRGVAPPSRAHPRRHRSYLVGWGCLTPVRGRLSFMYVARVAHRTPAHPPCPPSLRGGGVLASLALWARCARGGACAPRLIVLQSAIHTLRACALRSRVYTLCNVVGVKHGCDDKQRVARWPVQTHAGRDNRFLS